MKTKIFLLLGVLLCLIACGGSDDDNNNTPSVTVNIKKTTFSFNRMGGEETFQIVSNAPVQLQSQEPSWCEVSKLNSTSATSPYYKLTIAPNTTLEKRTAIILVTAQGFEKQLTVEQEKGIEKGPEDEPIEEPQKFLVREKLTTQQLVNEMGLGINLGNTLDAVGDWIDKSSISNYETAWGSPIITKEMIEGYAKAGYKSLRIPVSWCNLMAEDNTIHPDLMDRVESIVNWTMDCGMVALVNIHHENEWINKVPTDNNAKQRFISIWQQVSQRLEKYGDHLMFEPMNEVGFSDVWNEWGGTAAQKAKAFGYVNELNQLFVDVVRASGGNNAKRHLLVEIYYTNDEYAYDPLTKIPNDPANRLALTVHYYKPSTFAILGNGEVADWGVGVASWGSASEVKQLNDTMEKLRVNCVDKGIPVVVGEYGCSTTNRTKEVVRLYCVSVTEAVYKNGMCPMLWDTPGTGQYDRSTCRFTDQLFLQQTMAIPGKYPR